jgi:hypothetical protein
MSTRTGCGGIWSLAVKKVFEHNIFVRSGLQHGLRTEGSAISLGEIASVGLHRPDTGFRNTQRPNVVADPSQGSRHRNVQAPKIVGGSFIVSRVAKMALAVRIGTTR